MSSKKFFKINKNKFDLIYIDGSHFSDDVKNDFNNSLKIANKDCIIILDDLLWNFYKKKENNPISGIFPILSKNNDLNEESDNIKRKNSKKKENNDEFYLESQKQ
jgi:predicted O-methyltransferase YrrM